MWAPLVTAIGLAFLVSGCNSSEPAIPLPGGEIKSSRSVGQALRELEDRGVLPRLDRGPGLAGTDRDGDGLRDDLAAYIDKLDETPARRAAMRQMAKALSNTLVADISDDQSLRAAGRMSIAAVRCMVLTFGGEEGEERVGLLRSLVVNTKERFIAYDRYNAARSGSVTRSPDGNTCV